VIVTATTGSEVFLVDSSGWVEFFGASPKGLAFAPYLDRDDLLVPTIVIYEVLKKLTRDSGKTEADRFVSHALRRVVVPLDRALAVSAAAVSLDSKLAMADAIIYATAQAYHAQLITGDLAFRGLPGVIIP
jgi:predicted nucleic acid-binding protein